MAKVKLFMTWSSPFSLRIVWALQLKGVLYETIHEDLSNKSPLLLQSNPTHKKVPVLLHNGNAVVESLIVLEYVNETWKENPLLPEDPLEQAIARFWARYGDEKLNQTIITYLEEELNSKKFFGGEKLGFADIALGWLAHYVSVFEDVADMKMVTEEEFPLLSAWAATFADVPIIKDNWPSIGKLIAKFQASIESHLSKMYQVD